MSERGNIVRGVVAKAKGEPVSVETVIVPDPGAGEVVVRIQACGVCHTDLHYKMGGIGDDYFEVNHNVGRIAMFGDYGDDVFFLKAYRTSDGKLSLAKKADNIKLGGGTQAHLVHRLTTPRLVTAIEQHLEASYARVLASYPDLGKGPELRLLR